MARQTQQGLRLHSHICRKAQGDPVLQVVFNPSPDSPADGLGYLAAARNLIRLHTISPALFPLPHALAREAAGAHEDIDLPDESSEDATGGVPASQQDARQRLYTAAGVCHTVVHSASPTRWTKLESFEPLNLGKDSPVVVAPQSGEEVFMFGSLLE